MAVVTRAENGLMRQPMRISCDKQSSPSEWISEILSKARGRSVEKAERHLVGATLKARFPNLEIPNYPRHAADAQAKSSDGFPLGRISYHVTATDGKEAIPRCKENVETG